MDKSGAVLGLSGGNNYQQSQFNRAISAKRQAGSAFKTLLYLSAFENNYKIDDVFEDKKLRINNWLPDNYESRFLGKITLKKAFANSSNSVAVQLYKELGAKKIAKTIVDTATNEPLTEDEENNAKIKVPIIVKAERHPLPALKNRIILTLSNGEKVSVPDNELEGIYGGDINDLDYYVGQEWDQEPYVDTNTGEVRESKVKTLKEAKEVMSSGKETYAKFEKEAPANLQEIITGIKIEHDCNPDKSYKDIVKLVVKNLKKQPNYYTNWKLSGIEGTEPKVEGSVKPEDRKMKFAKDDNTVDKAMGMKPVKGVENAKASANKAKKETTKAEKVDLMSLIAQTVRGLQKMNATGEKMKKVVVK
jgi:hypothetical protein